MTSIQVLETLSLVAPAGLRFRDSIENAAVSEGLSVVMWPKAWPDQRIPAVLNRSDVFGFPHPPGMRDIESGAGDDAFWIANPPRFDFVVQVSDADNRFLPFQFPVRLPVRGIPDAIPLFSSPARVLVSPTGVIRAQLFDAIHQVPAAWALAEARVDGVAGVSRGMADSQGSLLLPLPYPETQSSGPAFGSPLTPSSFKIYDQTWQVHLAFYYSPQLPSPAIPDLSLVLNQSPAATWEDDLLSTPLTSATLRFGQDLVLRSRALLTSPPASPWRSTLLITPAGSPP